MARLTAAARRRIPKGDFGLPGARGKGSRGGKKVGKYPMPDRRHAAIAKAYARKEEEEGKLSKSAEEKIDARANRKLGESGHKGAHSHKRHAGRRRATRRATRRGRR